MDSDTGFKTHRCRECSLVRVYAQGMVCEECVANMQLTEAEALKRAYAEAPPGGWYYNGIGFILK